MLSDIHFYRSTNRPTAAGLDDDRSVSPVIGIALLIAITVLLAAMTGMYLLGLSDSVDDEAQAAVSIDTSDGIVEVEVTAIATGDHLDLTGDVRNEDADCPVSS